MSEDLPTNRQPMTKEQLDAVTVGGARPHGGPVQLAVYDPQWPALFEREAARIRQVLRGTAVRIEHVGSTSVPGLAAKPIIDITLEVPNSSDESTYVAPLERHGYQLRIRESDWFEHRVLKGPDTDINLHVFSAGCTEVGRMLAFRDHLRANAEDRMLCESTKRDLASQHWAYIQNYADAKSEVVAVIMSRAWSES